MHRSYNSDEKGIVSGQGTYVAYRTVSENTGNNIVRGEKKSLKILLKILFNILFKIFFKYVYFNVEIISKMNKSERQI